MKKIVNIIALVLLLFFVRGCVHAKEYTITFESNGGSLVQPIVVSRDVQIEEPSAPTKEGHTFGGWYIDIELTNPYEFTTMPNHNLKLYAKWEINTYTITFESNGGSFVQPIVMPRDVQIEEPSTPTKEGYTFEGWYIDIELTNYYDFTIMPSHNLTLYAKWEIKTYTITFQSNGGSFVQPIVVPSDVQIEEPNAPTKEGYNFIQWHEDSNLSTPFDFDTFPTKDLTLYAEWDIYGTEGLIYEKTGNSYAVTGYLGSDKDVMIPKYYNSLPVQSIGNSSFRFCSSLTSITIPNTVTTIGDKAFNYCTSLISITIPEGVTSIGDWAFASCISLTSITISEGVTSIGDFALAECTSLASITLPNTLITLGDNAFISCISLTSITIPEGVTSIGEDAFYNSLSLGYIDVDNNNQYFSSIDGVLFNKNQTEILRYPEVKAGTTYGIPEGVTIIGIGAFQGCSTLTSINIPQSVTSIGDEAFEDCSSLSSIIIPEGVTLINIGLFSGCTSLTSIIIPEGVTSIGDWAFAHCRSLTSIIIPEGVTSIGVCAFVNCSGLTSILIPNNVTSIGISAFSFCSLLTSITIPESVTSIGSYAFDQCNGLTIINVDNNNQYFSSIDGVLFNKNQTEILRYPEGKTGTTYTIPEGVTIIGNGAFEYCSSLTSIIIPEGVTKICDFAFNDCSTLVNINVPESVTSIGTIAFANCTSLTSIIIPEGVTRIDDLAFANCTSLTSIIIPEGVTSIDDLAFKNCSSLTSIIIPKSVTSIGSHTFSGCTSLTSIIIPIGVTSINWNAFLGCSFLTIYCEVEDKPNGWDSSWNPNNRPIVWGYYSQ